MLRILFFLLASIIGFGSLSHAIKGQTSESLADKIESVVELRNVELSPKEKWTIKQNILAPLKNSETGEKLNVFNLKWKSEKNYVDVEIVECESQEKAVEAYKRSVSGINGGLIKTFTDFGENGIIVTDLPRDTITGINFVKGNYYVSVYAGSKEIAVGFAKLVDKTID